MMYARCERTPLRQASARSCLARMKARIEEADCGRTPDGLSVLPVYHPAELRADEDLKRARPAPEQVLHVVQGINAVSKARQADVLGHVADLLGLCDADFTRESREYRQLARPLRPLETRSLRQAFMKKELSLDYWSWLEPSQASYLAHRRRFWAVFQYVLWDKPYTELKGHFCGNSTATWAGRWRKVAACEKVPFHGAPPGLRTDALALTSAATQPSLPRSHAARRGDNTETKRTKRGVIGSDTHVDSVVKGSIKEVP